MINFKLQSIKEIDAALDGMRRSWVGWSPTMTDQEVYERNRGVWLLGPRAEQERYATFSVNGTVRVVVELEGIEAVSAPVANVADKSAIIGQVLGPGDAAYDVLIGRAVDGNRNPVSYIDDDGVTAARTCSCGCGGPVQGQRIWIPGHDQRAVSERITAGWGSSKAFVDWFDAGGRSSGEGPARR